MLIDIEEKKKKIEGEIDAFSEKFGSSGAVSVFKDGNLLLRRAFGGSTENSRFVMTLECDFYLCLMLLLLVQQKKLRFSDKLSRFIPEYRYADEITVRNLLDGKTGIRDFFYGEIMRSAKESDSSVSDEERRVRDAAASTKYYSFEEVLSLIGELPLESKPGTEAGRGTGLYPFMRTVIERASGKSLWDFAYENIFSPLGMKNTLQGGEGIEYTILFRNKKPLSITPDPDNPYIFTTDLADTEKLLAAFFGFKLLSEKNFALAADFKDDGDHWGLGLGDGYVYAFFSLYGTNGSGTVYHDFATGVSIAVLSPKEEKYIEENGSYFFFRKELRRALAEEFTFPRNTKMVRYNKRNRVGAMGLEVTKEQLDFVDDAKTTIAYAASDPKFKLFVEEESGRAVGLLSLYVDKKNDIYDISIVLIDKRYQHRGFGKIMLEFAVDYLKKAGAKRLEIGVNRFNLSAQKLYKSVGFTEDNVFEEGIMMSQKLDEGK